MFFKGHWSARHKDGRCFSFSSKQFGSEGAQRLAAFTKNMFERREDSTLSKERILELFEEQCAFNSACGIWDRLAVAAETAGVRAKVETIDALLK